MKVLVTGGSRGIGKAIVDLFIHNGHSVSSPTRSELDLTQPINLQDREFDIVINCAGINPIKTLDWIHDNEVMMVNYLSPLEIIQQCLPYMVEKQYGRIINIGSIWIDTAKPGRLAYSASKNALHALTKAITAEYGHWGILANTVSPGFIETELTFQNNTPDEILKMIHNIPANRLGKPEEVAKLVYQLTIENTFISGQNIIIDGGFSCTTY
jgi:NAD(P)-dependent dehydrogenase (short-subunit alcohol dehydrogenase family)